MHTILSNSDAELPHDMLETNGKLIKFIWGVLCFLDLCLPPMSSLKKACKAYAIETQKLELPHRYLQNRINRGDILAAMNAKVSWKQLGKYIDWFGDKDAEDLQFRREGRTHEEWIEEQPMKI